MLLSAHYLDHSIASSSRCVENAGSDNWIYFYETLLTEHTDLFYLYTIVAKVVAAGSLPVAAITAPAFALDSIVASMPTTSVALEVQFGAYLAVALGTLLPVLFLINLFIQTESRKAGREGGIDAE
jgi:photosystem II reaction center protein PsbM